MPISTENLWRRDLIALLRLAGPVAAGRLGIMAMGLTDSLVVGRFSAVQLGFLALGWTLPAVAMVGAMGFLQGVPVMSARHLGAGRPELTGAVFKRGLRYALAIGVLVGGMTAWFGPTVLASFRLAPGLAEGAAGPLRVFALSLPVILAAACSALYLEAIGRAGTSTALMWTANLVNLGLDLLLVPGRFGLPAMGATGSAWSTFGARGFLAVALLLVIFRMKGAHGHGLLTRAVGDPLAAREQRRLGYGAGTSQLVESAAFSGMNVVAGWVGALAVAGWAVVLNLTGIVFMTPLGLSTAASVLVGRAYGACDEAGVRRAAILGFMAAAAYGVAAALLVWLLHEPIAAAYSADPALIAVAGAALSLSGLYLAPDAIQVVAAQALRARADVLVPTVTHIASYAVVMLPLGWLLADRLHLGVAGIVLAVTGASWMAAALLLGRFWMLGRREA